MGWKITTAAGLSVLVAAVIVRTQYLDTATVSSDSMAPTVCTGDVVLLARLHGDDTVQIGQIVVFPSPQDGVATIKRVVAGAGQTVAIKDAELYVDDRRVDEPYVDRASIDGVYFGTVTVPSGSVFVMGDHRETSIDSRAYGPIPTSQISGRLLADLWSEC